MIAVTTEGEEGILPAARAVSGGAAARAFCAPTSSKDGTASRLELATSEGFMQALPDRVTVLVDEAVRFEDVVVAEARESSWPTRSSGRKSAGADRELFAREQAVIDFANAKLRLTGH